MRETLHENGDKVTVTIHGQTRPARVLRCLGENKYMLKIGVWDGLNSKWHITNWSKPVGGSQLLKGRGSAIPGLDE